jgi:hypothetical protein
MNVKTILGLGALGGVIYLATNKPARTKTKKAIGLSDSFNQGKEPAKIKKLRGIVFKNQYEKIGGSIIDVQTATLILQIYDNLPVHIRTKYAKKSIQEMGAIAWEIKGKTK